MRSLTLLLFVVALVEGFLIWELWSHRTTCAASTNAAPATLLNGAGGGGGLESGSGNGSAVVPSPAVPASANPASSGAASGGSASNQAVSGDLKQVPDPNCVGKTAASLLNSGQSTTPPSCAPMSPPPQLQQAEKQVQGGAAPASTP
jgi:hypothetical protein